MWLFFLLFPWLAYAQIDEGVLICGVCKDVAARLPYTIEAIQAIGACFREYRVFVYENNSADATVQLLREWEAANPCVQVESEQLTEEQLAQAAVARTPNGRPYRTELIARARNCVLHRALTTDPGTFRYLIMLDMDMLFYSIDGIRDSFAQREQVDWDAIFANGLFALGGTAMYDGYAYRSARHPYGPELLGDAAWYALYSQYTVKGTSELVPVYSAFGGLAIYKRAALEEATYAGLVNKAYMGWLQRYVTTRNMAFQCNMGAVGAITCCEHVALHCAMIMRGHGALYINPKLVTVWSGAFSQPFIAVGPQGTISYSYAMNGPSGGSVQGSVPSSSPQPPTPPTPPSPPSPSSHRVHAKASVKLAVKRLQLHGRLAHKVVVSHRHGVVGYKLYQDGRYIKWIQGGHRRTVILHHRKASKRYHYKIVPIESHGKGKPTHRTAGPLRHK